MATVIKICGITRAEDGLAALRAGADRLGFIRVPGTPRFRDFEEMLAALKEIRARAPRAFEAVGVYADAGLTTIEDELARARFDRIQLHGAETLEFAQALRAPVTKTIKIADAGSIARAEDYPNLELLADTADPRLPGGTGRGYDAALIAPLVARRRVLVAGGLGPGNVGERVRLLRPFGVDVSSGVESAPGVKDAAKMEAFARAVREADADGGRG